MTNLVKKDSYSVILILVLLVSLIQLNLLINGIYSVYQAKNEVQAQEIGVQPAPTSVPVNFTPAEIIIPKIKLDLPIISVPVMNGTWQVNKDVANFAEGTSLVNEKTGNVGIYAHDNKQGFTNIKKLIAGDTLVLKGSQFIAIYQVSKIGLANPIDVGVFYPTEKPQLTLVTCAGLFSEKRFILTADLVKIEKQ